MPKKTKKVEKFSKKTILGGVALKKKKKNKECANKRGKV